MPRYPSPRAANLGRGIGWWIGLTALVLLILGTIGAAFMSVPYYAIRPGTVRPTSGLIIVEGGPNHPPKSGVSYTTVNLRELTLLEAAAAWLDPDVDVVNDEVIRGDRSEDENRQLNVQMMDTSKQEAITVALQELGYEVEVRTSGTVVTDVDPEAPAGDALEMNDVIVRVDGEAVDEPDEIGELLQRGGVGAEHELVVERGPKAHEVPVVITTVASPDDPERAIVGIVAQDRIVDFEYPFEIDIDSGNVGGPSAGLAFTLAILDHLTPGELTGGTRVAVTGTIGLDGTVGEIGGAPQKAVAVRNDGYEVFIVPKSLVRVVREKAGDDLRVIGVSNLDEALEALASLGGNALALGKPGAERPAA